MLKHPVEKKPAAGSQFFGEKIPAEADQGPASGIIPHYYFESSLPRPSEVLVLEDLHLCVDRGRAFRRARRLT